MRPSPRSGQLAIRSKIEFVIYPELNEGESVCPVIFIVKESMQKNESFIR